MAKQRSMRSGRWVRSAGAGLALLGIWLCASRAHADTPQPEGFEFGVRSGFGLALGSSTGALGDDFNKSIANMVPIWLDAGARVTPHVFLGAYFAYGIGFLPDSLATSCKAPGVSCSLHDVRFGGEAHYHIGQDVWDPWIGLGIGFESFGLDASGGGGSASAGASGVEFLNLQLGLDYRAANVLGVGPFATLTTSQFLQGSSTVPGASSMSGTISNQAIHEWFMIGLRVVFDLSTKRPRQPPEPPAEDKSD